MSEKTKEAIVLHVKWDKELALKSSKAFYDWEMRHSAKRYVGWFFVAMLQFGIVGALKHDSFGLLFLSTFFLLYWYWGRWLLRKKMLERYYERTLHEPRELEFSISQEGIQTQNGIITWEDVKEVVALKEGFLTITSQESFFLPNKVFKDAESRSRFVSLLKKLTNYRE